MVFCLHALIAHFGALGAPGTAEALPALPDEPAPVRRAILIGINEYRSDQFPDLRGAVNDVEKVRDVLTVRFGFSPENITVLTDAAATRKSILVALDRLAREASPRDVVYLHYSGHGSQVEDLNGDEQDDNLDETLLPHDGRMDGVPDITDDEIGEFLNRLRAETAIIVLDSCHSGTATRGGLVTRSVPSDSRLELYRRPDTGVATRAIVQLDTPERYVLLTGAASHQSALDGPVGGEFYGFFSYALTEGLSVLHLDASPNDLHESIRQTFRRLSESLGGYLFPEPQIEADPSLLDRPLFPAPLPSAGPSVLTVRWDRVDPALQKTLEEHILERLPEIEFVRSGEFARFVVDVVDGQLQVYGAAGLTIVDEFRLTNPEEAARRLAGLFSRSLKASSLVALTNPASGLDVIARVVGVDDGGKVQIFKKGNERNHRTSLMLEIQTSADSFITIVDVDAKGGINVLFPNPYTNEGFLPQGFIEGGQTVRIPDSFEKGNRAGFHWNYQPPAGMDTIQVFASTDLETAETVREWLGEIPGAATRGTDALAKRSDVERLVGLRDELARSVGHRGIGVVRDESGTPEPSAADWNSVSLRIRVVE